MPRDAKTIEPFSVCIDPIMREWTLPEYRADLWRAFELVVALFCAVASTSVVAREFSAADTRNQNHPTAQRPSRMVSSMGRLIVATAQQIKHIHRVE